MRSMTGYGHAKGTFAGQPITVEISSVNRKQSEITLTLPRALNELEPRLRDEINARISRGRLTVAIALHQAPLPHSSARATIDLATAKAYHGQLRRLQRHLKLTGPICLDTILRGPGVLDKPVRAELDAETVWPSVRKVLRQALADLLGMRRREGAALTRDLKKRLKAIRATAQIIAKHAPQVIERHRTALRARAKSLDIAIALNDERLLKEIVFFADKTDISEELTRFHSHLDQVQALLNKDEAVGRTLDFIIQELNREVNTIASKANDITISQAVVSLKTELEKIREQVQNIE